jgi:uncharacterized membrane protein YphA (DoxX/SURF4 family)
MNDSKKTQPNAGKWLRVALWSAQILLAVVFGMFGLMKITTPIAQLSKGMPWVADYAMLIRFIGLSEVAGAIGLLLPALTRIAPVLTPIAASGLVIIMVLALAFHAVRGEYASFPFVIALGAMAAFVAWGRFGRAAIAPRGTAPTTLRSVTE